MLLFYPRGNSAIGYECIIAKTIIQYFAHILSTMAQFALKIGNSPTNGDGDCSTPTALYIVPLGQSAAAIRKVRISLSAAQKVMWKATQSKAPASGL